MKNKVVLVALIIMSSFTTINAQVSYKAKFINGFTRYMDWPTQAKKGQFSIGIYGSYDLYKEITKETMGRTVGNQNVVTVNILRENLLTMTPLHILVVGREYCTEEHMKNITAKFSNSFTLIVTEQDGMSNGAGISFTGNGQSLGFNYNADNIKEKGIIVSKQLVLMATP